MAGLAAGADSRPPWLQHQKRLPGFCQSTDLDQIQPLCTSSRPADSFTLLWESCRCMQLIVGIYCLSGDGIAIAAWCLPPTSWPRPGIDLDRSQLQLKLLVQSSLGPSSRAAWVRPSPSQGYGCQTVCAVNICTSILKWDMIKQAKPYQYVLGEDYQHIWTMFSLVCPFLKYTIYMILDSWFKFSFLCQFIKDKLAHKSHMRTQLSITCHFSQIVEKNKFHFPL